MVVMFGANDAQRMKLDGNVYDVSTPEWQAEYRRRVDAVMGFLTQGGTRHVYWIGQPVMRSGDFDQKQIILEGIYREEAAKHPGVTFIHIRTMFAGPDGAFSAYLRRRERQAGADAGAGRHPLLARRRQPGRGARPPDDPGGLHA